MRQVPTYLLIGNGRVARHFRHYLSLLNLNYICWTRADPQKELEIALKKATHVLILISDAAIEPFIRAHLSATSAILIHFSGSVVSDLAIGVHPLASFNQSLWDLAQYQAIPFVCDEKSPDLEILLPGLPNQAVHLPTSLKAKYHALCVLSGNFTCLLWQKFFLNFENELHFPAEIAEAYLRNIMQNLLTHPHSALTGPLVRGDVKTIENNLAALQGDPFKPVYQSFVTYYQEINKVKCDEHF